MLTPWLPVLQHETKPTQSLARHVATFFVWITLGYTSLCAAMLVLGQGGAFESILHRPYLECGNLAAWMLVFVLHSLAFIRARIRELVHRTDTADTFDVFLSHDWGTDEQGRSNHERVAQVNAALKRAGLVTWFDEERMRGDIVKQMTDGIDRSSVVLVFVTRNYIRKVAGEGPNGANDNCKAEFDYACNRKGVERMVAVVMETDCTDSRQWRGAVGMRLAGTLYHNLSGDGAQFQAGTALLLSTCAELIGNINSSSLELASYRL